MNNKYILTLDLKDDSELIAAYETHHKAVWPEIIASIKDAGIISMEIYRISNRLMMIMEVNEEFSFEKKHKTDSSNPFVQKWEELMWQYQQSLPFAAQGEKWVVMNKIFELG